MTLYLIGTGLHDRDDLSLKGLAAAKRCKRVYIENYTSRSFSSKEEFEGLIGKEVILADRDLVEQKAEETILAEAKEHNVAFLVFGDPSSATTHSDLMLRARKSGIQTRVIHNASVMSAIADTGLSLYKFGKTASVPFPQGSFRPESFYDTIQQNQSIRAHTLLLLDLEPKKGKYMTVAQAIGILLGIEAKRKEGVITPATLLVGCARLGSDGQTIQSGTPSELKEADLGEAPHCLIVCSDLHFMEEEGLKTASGEERKK
ncbi:diphthine synthase [Candidatus Woesearchaeota archaeon]|nr:diphthine synthase [Candidatus Woesearchaeota archaeon]